MNESAAQAQQEEVCKRFNAGFREANPDEIVGVADNIKSSQVPLNGLRHSTSEGTTGWFIWSGGEPSKDPRFFKPMHLKHLIELRPEVLPYLGLAPGWRFLIDPTKNHEDVWFDQSLILDE